LGTAGRFARSKASFHTGEIRYRWCTRSKDAKFLFSFVRCLWDKVKTKKAKQLDLLFLHDKKSIVDEPVCSKHEPLLDTCMFCTCSKQIKSISAKQIFIIKKPSFEATTQQNID
jgi:hypothetical protein